ncbi:unnamed protein product [Prunus armeniaca]|uniref:Uncharacterized protein n=1 Tax=Prunus armeniaca TaxID=36596 RepID=A0A6J5VY66_PRUAR|nr:unnamed protein product [Prunus armeniaca]
MESANCRRRGLVAHAPPPGYFVRLENTSTDDDLYLRKKVRMRKWLCCTCHVEESYPSNENERLKSPKHYTDGEEALYACLLSSDPSRIPIKAWNALSWARNVFIGWAGMRWMKSV